MELTVNTTHTNSFIFTDGLCLHEKLNKNTSSTLKRLQVKHKNKRTTFKKWFSMEHDYCLPTKKKNNNGCDVKDDGYSEETCKFQSKSTFWDSLKKDSNLEKINSNYEHSCNEYAIDVTTELLKDALFENQSNYEQSSGKTSKSCINSVGSFELTTTNQHCGSNDCTIPREPRIESTSLKYLCPMDIDNDMIKLFPTLDFSTEHISNEKIGFAECRATNTDEITLPENKVKTNIKKKKCSSFSLEKRVSNSPEFLKLENVNESKIDASSPNSSQKLFSVNSKNITYPTLVSEQYINIFNRYQVKSKGQFIEHVEDPGPILLRDLLCGSKPKTIISPYTQRHLKPYILRDSVTKPLWLQMLNELKEHFRLKKGLPTHVEVETIDYSYVRANHIKSVNALARQFFWPGIDLTESLLYPDFSVIALYKNLVIGFGFMVPDITTNENYITFLFTRPHWTNCGIAKFMIYHLIQTCMTRDITLHVSSNSSAMILYQKFGFKIEEFVQNFYENYISGDSAMSKNALFLRLRSSLHRK